MTREKPLIICVGEVLWDCFPDRKVLGGAPLNLAYIAQSAGAESCFISRVGDDDDGRKILSVMMEKGLDTRYVQKDRNHPTGVVQVDLSPAGEPTFTIVEDVAYDHISWDNALKEPLSLCQAICFGSLAQRNAVSRMAIAMMLKEAANAVKVYDINLRQHFFTKEILADGFRRAQVVKMNDGEFDKLQGLFAEEFKGGPAGFMKHFDIDLLAVTRGGDGCTLYRRGEQAAVPGIQVKVQDTVGSGDAFTAAMILAYLRGESLLEIGRQANLMGAYVATQCGGTPPIRREALEAMRKQG